ncbi:MAG: hypothetical protein ACRDL1_00660 [Solirubrobacterales bacterium]
MSSPDPEAHDSDPRDPTPSIQRLLVISDAAVADVDELPPLVRAIIDAAAEIYVVTPSLPGRLAWLADQLNRSRHAADERLDAVLGNMRSTGTRTSGMTGDDTTLTAVSDAVAKFQPNHLLIALRSPDHANWQEQGLIEKIRERFGLPLTTFAVDPRGQV